jgi:hypothetical protein
LLARKRTKERRAQLSELNKTMSNSEEHLNRLKELHEGPHREKLNEYLRSEEHKNHLKKLHEDPAINAKRIESLKVYHASKSGISDKQYEKLLENSRSEKNLANLEAYNTKKSIQVKVFDNETGGGGYHYL